MPLGMGGRVTCGKGQCVIAEMISRGRSCSEADGLDQCPGRLGGSLSYKKKGSGSPDSCSHAALAVQVDSALGHAPATTRFPAPGDSWVKI